MAYKAAEKKNQFDAVALETTSYVCTVLKHVKQLQDTLQYVEAKDKVSGPQFASISVYRHCKGLGFQNHSF